MNDAQKSILEAVENKIATENIKELVGEDTFKDFSEDAREWMRENAETVRSFLNGVAVEAANSQNHALGIYRMAISHYLTVGADNWTPTGFDRWKRALSKTADAVTDLFPGARKSSVGQYFSRIKTLLKNVGIPQSREGLAELQLQTVLEAAGVDDAGQVLAGTLDAEGNEYPEVTGAEIFNLYKQYAEQKSTTDPLKNLNREIENNTAFDIFTALRKHGKLDAIIQLAQLAQAEQPEEVAVEA